MSRVVKLGSGEVALERPKRRQFSAEYRLKILEEVDACTLPGQIGATLRRENLYSSHLTKWRRQRESGELSGLMPVKSGPKAKPHNPYAEKNKELEKENKALKRKLQRTEWMLEMAKKASELMEKMALGHQLENEDSE